MIIRNIKKYLRITRPMEEKLNLQEFAYSQTTSRPEFKASNRQSRRENDTKSGQNKMKPSTQDRTATLNKIIEWRKHNQAPVDTMGCERLADPKAPIQIQKFQTLVALMLSVQTKDQTTFMIVNRLKQQGLTPDNIAKYSEEKLRSLIYQSNFNKRKAANLIAVSRTILQNGRIARTKQELMAYPGVGIKIAMIYLKVAEGKEDQGIGVDTHVHRIANRLGWAKSQSPEETQHQLQEAFPLQYWKQINIALVGFGQIQCQAKRPLCEACPVMKQCPSAKYEW